MGNVATSVRVNGDAHAALERISASTKQSKSEIIEQALRELEERMFWQEVHDAYAKPESAEMKAERKLWDKTVGDGMSKWKK
jgi:predicted transcriptional regulator